MKILLRPSYKESEQVRIDYFGGIINGYKKLHGAVKILDIGSSQLSFKNEPSSEIYEIDYIDKPNANNFKQVDLNKEKIPFDSEFFDIIIAGEVIEHIKRPFEFIEECSRLLKKDGICIISTPTPYYYIEILKELFGITLPDDPEHLNLLSRAHLVSYMERNGFKQISFKRYKFWIPIIKLMILSINSIPFLNQQMIFVFKKI